MDGFGDLIVFVAILAAVISGMFLASSVNVIHATITVQNLSYDGTHLDVISTDNEGFYIDMIAPPPWIYENHQYAITYYCDSKNRRAITGMTDVTVTPVDPRFYCKNDCKEK